MNVPQVISESGGAGPIEPTGVREQTADDAGGTMRPLLLQYWQAALRR